MAEEKPRTPKPPPPSSEAVNPTWPEFVKPPSWWKPGRGRDVEHREDRDISLQDWVHQYVTNQLIPYMDPYTQRETAQWLTRDNPLTFGTYDEYLAAQPRSTHIISDRIRNRGASDTLAADYLNPERLGAIVEHLDYDNILENMPPSLRHELGGKALPWPTVRDEAIADEKKKDPLALTAHDLEDDPEVGRKTGLNLKSTLRWLTEAMETAKGGLRGHNTSIDQLTAARHLDTLFKEADQDPEGLGRYKSLVENVLNPVQRRGRRSGVIGNKRVVLPPKSDYRRGGWASKNPIST